MDVLAIARMGMQNDLLRAESVSHNVANVLTPGYKKQIVVAGIFTAQMDAAMNRAAIDSHRHTAPTSFLSIDASAGTSRYTGNAQDVSIEGANFLEVATPAGSAYTRQGNLRADVQGRLVTGNGMPVIGGGGEIFVTNAPFSVSPNGDVEQEGRVIGRLKLVAFTNPGALVPIGAGVYQRGAAQLDERQNGDSLRIGFQESSNVSSPQEMVRLTETVRHFESLQKIVQGYDASLENTIRKLGEI